MQTKKKCTKVSDTTAKRNQENTAYKRAFLPVNESIAPQYVLGFISFVIGLTQQKFTTKTVLLKKKK